MKEAEDNTNIDNTVLMDWLFYPRKSTDWMQSISSNDIFYRFRKKMILKCVWDDNKTRLTKAVLRKKSKAGGIMFPDLKYTTKQQ